MTNENLQGEEEVHSKNYFLNTSFPSQNKFKKCKKKLNFAMSKALSKNYTLDYSCKCSCTFSYNYA